MIHQHELKANDVHAYTLGTLSQIAEAERLSRKITDTNGDHPDQSSLCFAVRICQTRTTQPLRTQIQTLFARSSVHLCHAPGIPSR